MSGPGPRYGKSSCIRCAHVPDRSTCADAGTLVSTTDSNTALAIRTCARTFMTAPLALPLFGRARRRIPFGAIRLPLVDQARDPLVIQVHRIVDKRRDHKPLRRAGILEYIPVFCEHGVG